MFLNKNIGIYKIVLHRNHETGFPILGFMTIPLSIKFQTHQAVGSGTVGIVKILPFLWFELLSKSIIYRYR